MREILPSGLVFGTFNSAIHTNSSLKDIDKFNYLRSVLKGTACEAVAGLTLTEANYSEAISVLKRRFGNKQQIISQHMDALVSVSAVTNDHDVKALHRLYDDVIESNVRSLKGLEAPAESYGRLLAPVIMSKLPSELRLILGHEMGDEDWNLEVILENLGKEVETRERTASAGLMSKRPPREQPTAAALLENPIVPSAVSNTSL